MAGRLSLTAQAVSPLFEQLSFLRTHLQGYVFLAWQGAALRSGLQVRTTAGLQAQARSRTEWSFKLNPSCGPDGLILSAPPGTVKASTSRSFPNMQKVSNSASLMRRGAANSTASASRNRPIKFGTAICPRRVRG